MKYPYLVHHLLEHSAERLPDKEFIVCGDRRLTYAEVNEKADRLAAGLIELGVRRQDRAAIFLDNSAESVIALFGILKAGAIFIMLSATMKAKKLNYILNNSGARVLVTHPQKSRIVNEAAADAPDLKTIIWCNSAPNQSTNHPTNISWNDVISIPSAPMPSALCPMPSAPLPSAPCPMPYAAPSIDLDLATIIYTSGSTGEPKGVMSAHGNVLAAARSISSYLENVEDDIILSALPLSFDYGLYQVLMAALFAGTVVLEKSFVFPYKVLERLVQEKATGFPIVPTMLAMLLQMDNLERFDFGRLRYVSNTAAALPVSHIRKLRGILPHVSIYSMYGLTECKRVSYLPPDEIDRKPDSVGIPIPNEEVFIVDEHGSVVPPGVVGELVVRGANVMQGYWRDAEETAKRFRPGKTPHERLLYSGDLFRRDEEGFLYFVARNDDMIKTKGERVSPKEIENVLCEMEGVAEAAVIGMPDDVFGQAIKAFVVGIDHGGVSEQAILKHCSQNLEPFMVPKSVVILDSFPKNASGKIDKKRLS